MLLLLDNYDSFVHTLARYFRELGAETLVVRSDSLTLHDIEELAPQALVLSPGPCSPNEAGITLDVVRRFAASIPMLGVCLGHQAIAAAFGGRVIRSSEPMHGMTSKIHHDGSQLFGGIPASFAATRYHSLIVEEATLPAELAVTAWSENGTIMALRHRRHCLHGVQFHPESILTEHGHLLLSNFLRIAGTSPAAFGSSEAAYQSTAVGEDFYSRPAAEEPLRPS